LVKQKQRQASGHAAVSIQKRMNAKKIVNIGWNEKKRFDLPILPELSELPVKRCHGIRGLMCHDRGKTAILVPFGRILVISLFVGFQLPPLTGIN
jgi:hypothetical protein